MQRPSRSDQIEGEAAAARPGEPPFGVDELTERRTCNAIGDDVDQVGFLAEVVHLENRGMGDLHRPGLAQESGPARLPRGVGAAPEDTDDHGASDRTVRSGVDLAAEPSGSDAFAELVSLVKAGV
jgi:hypothetical protein